jgi:hypothetical protein
LLSKGQRKISSMCEPHTTLREISNFCEIPRNLFILVAHKP